MKVPGFEGKRVLWEVVDDNVVEDPKDNDEIGIQCLDDLLYKD